MRETEPQVLAVPLYVRDSLIEGVRELVKEGETEGDWVVSEEGDVVTVRVELRVSREAEEEREGERLPVEDPPTATRIVPL